MIENRFIFLPFLHYDFLINEKVNHFHLNQKYYFYTYDYHYPINNKKENNDIKHCCLINEYNILNEKEELYVIYPHVLLFLLNLQNNYIFIYLFSY